MSYWQNGVVSTALTIAGLLLVAEVLRRLVPPMRRLGIPASIVAGCLGLGFGPDGFDVLPVDREVLEAVVYHGLAIVFIAVGLQSPETNKGQVASGVKSFTFGIPFMQALQFTIGLGVVLLLGLGTGETLHPGIGVMLPLGFEQGPGQAMSLGAVWEEGGMTDGAQVGLIVAAVGYGWSVVVGVPLVIWGRKRGLISKPRGGGEGGASATEDAPVLPAGAVELLTRQVIAIAGVYIITYFICQGLAMLLAPMPDIAAVVWGFHFMIGGGVAMGVRPLLKKWPVGTPLYDPFLGRVGGVTVDVMTCAALAAVQIAVFQANFLPIALVTTLGGLLTLVACVWLGSRAFPDATLEHVVVWFGMSTGTLPMGLALLRIVDPDMKSPAPISAVIGSAGAVLPAIPIVLVLIPMTVASWPDDYPAGGFVALGAAAVYSVVLLVLWRVLGPLRIKGRLGRLWHEQEEK